MIASFIFYSLEDFMNQLRYDQKHSRVLNQTVYTIVLIDNPAKVMSERRVQLKLTYAAHEKRIKFPKLIDIQKYAECTLDFGRYSTPKEAADLQIVNLERLEIIKKIIWSIDLLVLDGEIKQ